MKTGTSLGQLAAERLDQPLGPRVPRGAGLVPERPQPSAARRAAAAALEQRAERGPGVGDDPDATG